MKSLRHIRGTYWLIIAAMAFFTMAASSPQCAQSSDRALNPGFETLTNECINACNATSKAAKAVEKARYRAAREACNGDMACRAAEAAIHAMIQQEINDDKDACKLACQHEQGGSIGGQ